MEELEADSWESAMSAGGKLETSQVLLLSLGKILSILSRAGRSSVSVPVQEALFRFQRSLILQTSAAAALTSDLRSAGSSGAVDGGSYVKMSLQPDPV